MRRSWRGSYPRHQRSAAALTAARSSSSSATALTPTPFLLLHTQVRDLVGRVMANVYLAEGGGGEVKVELSPTPIRPPPPAEPQNAAAPSTAAVVVVAEAVETGGEAPAATAFEPAPFRFSIEVPPDTMLGAATKLGGLYSYAELRVKLI